MNEAKYIILGLIVGVVGSFSFNAVAQFNENLVEPELNVSEFKFEDLRSDFDKAKSNYSENKELLGRLDSIIFLLKSINEKI